MLISCGCWDTSRDWVASNNMNLFCHSARGQKPEIGMSAELNSPQGARGESVLCLLQLLVAVGISRRVAASPSSLPPWSRFFLLLSLARCHVIQITVSPVTAASLHVSCVSFLRALSGLRVHLCNPGQSPSLKIFIIITSAENPSPLFSEQDNIHRFLELAFWGPSSSHYE